MCQPLSAVSVIAPDTPPVLAQLGGKAYALARLGAAFPIPPWRVVPPDYPATQLAEALPAVLAALGPGPYAVRSSAVEEDQAQHSFAGQLQSFLNVPAPAVADRILAVRDSALTPAVAAYRQQQQLSGPVPIPAVLLQAMVPATVAGVAFSVDPLANPALPRPPVVINAVAGTAERLVSGEQDGDSYTWSREGQCLMTRLAGTRPVLDPARQQAVVALALRVEQYFGTPQDIEWAYAGETLYLLQARPITTVPQGEPVLWDNSNIVESYGGVTAPLTFSFACYVYTHVYQQFCRILGVSEERIQAHGGVFARLLGYVDGHVYYNLLNWYRILAMLPGFAINRRYMEQMLGVAEALPEALTQPLVAQMGSTGRWGYLVRSGLSLLRQAWGLNTRRQAFLHRLEQALQEPQPPWAARTLGQLAADYRALEQALLTRWDAPLLNDFLCMIAFGISKSLLLRHIGPEGAALHNDFLLQQGGIISAEPAQRIRQMADLIRAAPALQAALQAGDWAAAQTHPALAEALAAYLARFGDRCSAELKLESLPLDLDPVPLLHAIAYAAQGEAPPALPMADPEIRLRQALAGRPLRYRHVRGWLRYAQARVRDRENLRFQRTRLFGRVRRIFLAMGTQLAQAGILAQPRDVFYLELTELLGLVEGTSTLQDPAAQIALRRAAMQAALTRPAPPTRFWTYGAVCRSPRVVVAQPLPTGTVQDHHQRQGTGCAQGRVRAPVRVIHDPRTESLRAGEILVASHTDPGWIAHFSQAAGILVERGSLLSHSAIVARELGIPAVVAVPGLLAWLRTGDIVELDGSSGRVIRHPPSDPEA